MAPPPFPFPSPKLSGALAIAFTSGAATSAQAAPPGDAPAPQRPSSAPPVLPEPIAEPQPDPAVGAAGSVPDAAAPPALPGATATPTAPSTASTTIAPTVAPPAATTAADPNFAEIFDESDLPPTAGSEAGTDAPSTGLLRPTDKRKFFTLSLGTQASLLGAYSYSYYGASALPLRIESSVGAHFKRNALWGASFVVSDTLGTPFNSLQLGARVQRDRPFSERYGIYSQTAMTLSMRVNLLSYGLVPLPYGFGGAFEVSWGAKFIMAERLALTFRPVNVELAGDTATIFNLNWNIMVGVGTVW